MSTLPNAFRATVARVGDAPAIIAAGHAPLSFAELDRRSDEMAAYVQSRGLRKGDRALVAMPVGPALYVVLAGLWKAGVVAVFPEPALGLSGLRHAVRVTRPKAMVASGWYRWLRWLPGMWGLRLLRADGAGAVGAPVPVSAADAALISFTTGSTGAPKAISRSHGFLMAQYAAVDPMLATDRSPRDLVAFPVFVLVNLAAGRTSVLPNWTQKQQSDLSPETVSEWIGESGATRLLIPPSICETLGAQGVPRGVTDIFTGGGPVFPDVVQRLRHKRANLRVVAVYGSTEAEPIAELDYAETTLADWAAMKAGQGLLAGPPVAGLAVRIVDGEIQVSGAHVNQGYLDPAQDGDNKVLAEGRIWHRTGDAGRMDAKGRLWLLGRWHPGLAQNPPALGVEAAARFWPGVSGAALVQRPGGPILAVEGEGTRLPVWQAQAAALGVAQVVPIARIPMDRRHASKVDRAALDRLLAP